MRSEFSCRKYGRFGRCFKMLQPSSPTLSPSLPLQTGHVEPYINKEFHLGAAYILPSDTWHGRRGHVSHESRHQLQAPNFRVEDSGLVWTWSGGFLSAFDGLFTLIGEQHPHSTLGTNYLPVVPLARRQTRQHQRRRRRSRVRSFLGKYVNGICELPSLSPSPLALSAHSDSGCAISSSSAPHPPAAYAWRGSRHPAASKCIHPSLFQ